MLFSALVRSLVSLFFFFFNDTATTEIYTLSLHDALPICRRARDRVARDRGHPGPGRPRSDRKSTRLNSSHGYISYAVFCLKKKNNENSLASERQSFHHIFDVRKAEDMAHDSRLTHLSQTT